MIRKSQKNQRSQKSRITPAKREVKAMAVKKNQKVETQEALETAVTTAKPVRIFQEVELSFTENLIPVQIPVKQFDNQARKVRCRLYQNSVEYVVPEGTIISYSGTRPDGAVFQYSSESRPELVFVDSGTIILTVTSFMTEVYGRFPIDIYLLSDEGDVLGMFNLTLNVARAAITNRKIATLTYKQCVDATTAGIQGFYISEDGYLVMESDDELGLMKGSYSSTMEKVAADVYDKMVNTSIDGNGYLNFQSWDDLGLVFSLDEEAQLVIQYGEEKSKDAG